jgi:hypothetical protein
VALPMDEQRILEEMERMLAADDPRLAARLAAFGQPRLGHALRSRRARAVLSLMALVMIAAVATLIYLVNPFRPGSTGHGHRSTHVTHSAAPKVASLGSQAQCASTFAPSCVRWTLLAGRSAPEPPATHPQPHPLAQNAIFR